MASSSPTTDSGKPDLRRVLSSPWLFFALGAALYGLPSIILLRNYLQPAFDLAIYDQSLWLIMNGETFNTIIGAHVVGAHFSPILLPLAPLSLLPGGAVPELVAQAAILASGAFPASRLGIFLDRSPAWFMTVYIFHPALIGGSWHGFRPWNLAVAVFVWVVYLIWRRPEAKTIIIAGIVMLVFREDLAVWVGIACLVMLLAGRLTWRQLVLPGAVLALATALVMFLIIPLFSPTGSYVFGGRGVDLVSADTILSSTLIRVLFLFVPLGLAPSNIRWRLTIPLALPIVGLILRGGNGLTTMFHYDMMFVPLLLLIGGLSPRREGRLWVPIVATLVVLVSIGVLRPVDPKFGGNPFRIDVERTQQMDEVSTAVSAIPGYETLSLAMPSQLLPHYSERFSAFVFPSPLERHLDNRAAGEYVDTIRYSCPPPNIVVSDSDTITGVWPDLLRSTYIRRGEFGRYSVWEATREINEQPCSATWDPSR